MRSTGGLSDDNEEQEIKKQKEGELKVSPVPFPSPFGTRIARLEMASWPIGASRVSGYGRLSRGTQSTPAPCGAGPAQIKGIEIKARRKYSENKIKKGERKEGTAKCLALLHSRRPSRFALSTLAVMTMTIE